MNDNLSILELTCPQCGQAFCRRVHHCPVDGDKMVYACPSCEASCESCVEETQSQSRSLTLDDVIAALQELRNRQGGKSPVMICLDGPNSSPVPYLPVDEVAQDVDEPCHPVALLCVGSNHYPKRLLGLVNNP